MKLILAATITRTHGVKGQFKAKVLLSEPSNIFEYKIYDAEGRSLTVKRVGGSCLLPICSMESVNCIEGAKCKIGMNFYISKSELPNLPTGKFYKSDLIGLHVLNKKKEIVGIIEDIENFGAGEIVILRSTNGRRFSYPLTQQFFTHIDEQMIIEDIKNI